VRIAARLRTDHTTDAASFGASAERSVGGRARVASHERRRRAGLVMPVCGQPRMSAFSQRPDMTHRLLSRVSTRKRVPKEPGEKFVRFPVVCRRHLARCDEQPYCGLFHVKRRLNTPSRVLLLKPEHQCTPLRCFTWNGEYGRTLSPAVGGARRRAYGRSGEESLPDAGRCGLASDSGWAL
jgi:hypothetical protein